MKSTPSQRFSDQTRSRLLPVLTRRLVLLPLISFIAVAALLAFAASASRSNRAAKAQAELAATKSAINPSAQDGKQPNAPLAPSIVTTLTDNVTMATKVVPGTNINYTATITNNGAATPGVDDATNLNYTAPLSVNTNLVLGSVHASPIAFNDTYNWVGNTFLDTSARALPTVTANDVAVNAPGGTDTFTLTASAGATALGGAFSLAANGHYTYTPPLGRPNLADGATAQDSFTYTITNNADAGLTSVGTVRINLTGRVWYLQAGAAGDGRSNTPSSSPAAMSTAADKSTDIFYIFSNAASLNGPFSVDAGQQVLGQGVNLVVSAITLFNSAAPIPTTTNTAGNCVALAGAPGNNTLSGFNIGNCTGGTGITGANVGTLNVSTMTINTNGGALDLTGVGTPTVSIVLGGTTSTGGARNVSLVGLNGSFTLAGGALSGATGNALHVDGGNGGLTYSGTISNSGARQVNIVNKTAGTVSLSGAISGTGTGINLNTNTGATIDFTGNLTLNGASTSFTATGGGTVSSNNTASTIGATTAPSVTALNVANTNIGGLGLTFTSISCNGATKGIILNSTGTAAGNGGLTVNGTGTTLGSGGTIQNISQRGGEFITTKALTLKNMNFTNANTADAGGAGVCDDATTTACNAVIYLSGTTTATTLDRIIISGTIAEEGINGNNVAGLTFSNGTIGSAAGHCGDAVEEGCMKMRQASGTLAISNSTLQFGAEDVLEILNTSGALTLNVDSSTFSDTQPNPPGSTGIIARASGGSMTINVTNSNFLRLRSNAFNATAQGNSQFDIDISTSTFDSQAGIGIGIALASDNTANMVFNVQNNPKIWSRNGIAVSVLGDGTSTFMGRIQNNPSIQVQSGSGTGIGTQVNTRATGVVSITGNTVFGIPNDAGITAIALGKTVAGAGGTLDATITGNNVTIGDLATYNIETRSGSGSVGELNQPVCVNVANNVVSDPAGPNGGIFTWRARVANAAPNAQLNVQGFNTNIATTWAANGNTPASGTSQSIAGGGTAIGPCTATVPSNPVLSAPQPIDSVARTGNPENATVGIDTTKAALAKAPAVATPVTQISSKDDMASVLAKTTPKATAAEVARIYGSEGTSSHHAVRKNAFSQEPNAPTAGEIVTLNPIAIFPAGGKSITIKYSAAVIAPPAARSVQTQGTVSATNPGFVSVPTTDPETGTPVPTVTNIDALMTWNGGTSSDWNNLNNWTPPAGGTQYVPGAANPAVNDVVIPSAGVTNEPTIGAANPDITIFSLNVAVGRTLTIDPARTLTIGAAAPGVGGDLTLNGLITGGKLNFGTGSHIMTVGTGSLSSTNLATVLSGSTVTLNNNLQAGSLAVNAGGSMNITGRTLSLNGSGAALAVPGGATFTTTGSTVIFNGTVAQTAAGIAYNNLTINNTIGTNVIGVTLTGNATVNGALALTSSDLATGAFTLTQPNTTASTGVGDVIGTVSRTGGPFAPAVPLTFGNPDNRITFGAAGTKPTVVTVVLAKNTPPNPNNYAVAVQRTYTITRTGGAGFTGSTLRLHYLDAELNSNAEPLLNLRFERTGDLHWVASLPSVVDQTNNWVESNTVSDTNLTTRWTFSSLVPSASNGVVTGRIVDQSGNPVEGAVVRLEGTQNRKFITDANGVYRFDNVETGGFYLVTPSRANYSFNPSVRSFSQLGETTNAAFGATLSSSNLDNPLDTPEYFVRQHYIDFLGREPDEAGFNFWSDQVIGCGMDQDCIGRKRENVSAAFYLSIEFRRTGGLVDGVYRAAYGVRPNFAQFMPDARTVGQGVEVNKEGWETLLAANSEAYVNSFVNRPEFHQMYDSVDNSQFVDTMISHTGVSFTSAERDALVTGLGAGSMTRAEALRSIAENGRFVQAKFNETFVMMEYMGYLRRDPDAGGFAFWLNKLNEFNGNFEQAEMVKAFIVSGEYRDRFPK